MGDRLRAKPPTVDVDDWNRCTVEEVTAGAGSVRVTVSPAVGPSLELRLSEAQFELFTGRIEEPGGGSSGAIGTTAWYR
jgi:hypothetical protein